MLAGEAVLYPDFPPTEDPYWHCLTVSTELDSLTQKILHIIFHAFSALLSRLVCDQPGGVLDKPSANLESETQSVPKTNTISERDFAKLIALYARSQMPQPCLWKLSSFSLTTKQLSG